MFIKAPPLFQIGKVPFNITGLIILLEIIGMLIVVFTQGTIIHSVSFTSTAFLQGEFWRLFTYPIFSPISLSFIIGLFFFFQFGGMVEAQLGQKSYGYLCGMVVLTAALVLTLCHFIKIQSTIPLYGNDLVHLSVFCAFCIIHPNAPSFFGIQIKWFGLGFFILTILGHLQSGGFSLALACILSVSLALILIQSKGLAAIKIFPNSLTFPSAKPKKTQKKPSKKKRTITPKIKPKSSIAPDTEIDKILDKISEHGLHSLTSEEREKLSANSNK